MSVVNGVVRDVYILHLVLWVWEFIFSQDILFPAARILVVVVTVVLVLAIPYRMFVQDPGDCTGFIRARPRPAGGLAPPQMQPRLEKTTTTGKIRNLDYCRSEIQGWRSAMEDAACVDEFVEGDVPGLKEWSFFGVFDGHGGCAVSKRLASELSMHFYDVCSAKHQDKERIEASDVKYALGEAFARMDLSLRANSSNQEFDFVGSTAIVVVVNDETMVCANVGDSRALLCRNGRCESLSEDHKPEAPEERQRIENAGGTVAQIGPCYRVDGWGLNLSRAFGDFHYKKRTDLEPWEQKVTSEPEIRIMDLNHDMDTFFVLGCDGVFELLKNQDVTDFVHMMMTEKHTLEETVEGLLTQCISPNLMLTQGKGGDNVSVIVVKFPERGREK